MLIRSSVALALSIAFAVSLSPAQGRRGRRGPPSLVLEAIDIDGDGEISGEEMDEAVRSLLTLDRDGDGNLTSAELQPERGGFRGPPPGGMSGGDPLVRALDKDGDGELFEDEVTDAPRSLDRLDQNDDDVLTMWELEGGGGGGRGGRGGFPGGFGRPERGTEGGYDGTPTPSELKPEDGRATVPDRATFRELSYQGKEVMIDTHLADQEFVKFQIEDAAGAAPRLYFMNTKKYRAHPMFMQLIGVGGRGGRGGFGRPDRDEGGPVRMRGVLVYRPTLMSPSGQPGLYTFEFEPNDAYEYRMIRVAFDLLSAKSAELRENLSYNLLPRAAQQYELDKADYDRTNLPVFRPDDVYGEVAFLPLHPAAAYGRLRLMSQGERPSQRDVVIYRTLPNEMPRVAGVLTGVRQTPLSHVNLRAVQDDVPNAYVHGVVEDPNVQQLLGKLVHYVVTDAGYELREASQQEVDAHFEALRPTAPQTPPRDLSVREVRAFSDVGYDDSAAFGVKAANLATLRTFGFDGGRTPDGFAVPLSFYDAFMGHNGLYEMAREMMATSDFRSDAETRERALKAFRKKIKEGDMPAWMLDAFAAVQGRFPDGHSIRCRSSTNNEDLPGFSGAGLYDSFTHKSDEGHLAASVRQVFASLWNFRAYEEREFHRIDHLQAAMGVVLHPNQKLEQVNGVAVTKDVLYKAQHPDLRLYYVNAQVGEDLVTNPDAESVPEELLLSPRNARRDRVLQRSNRAPSEASLLSAEHRQELRRCMRILHDRFARLYGRSADDAFAMEIEFKVTRDGELLIKQARPWIE